MSIVRNTLAEGEVVITRSEIARRVCESLDWRNQRGELKEMGARVALLKLHRAGWIELPEPTHRNRNGNREEQH